MKIFCVGRRKLGISSFFIKVFLILKCGKTLPFVFCKTVYGKAQQMDMKTGVNMINMTGNVNDKMRKLKIRNQHKNKQENELEAI